MNGREGWDCLRYLLTAALVETVELRAAKETTGLLFPRFQGSILLDYFSILQLWYENVTHAIPQNTNSPHYWFCMQNRQTEIEHLPQNSAPYRHQFTPCQQIITFVGHTVTQVNIHTMPSLYGGAAKGISGHKAFETRHINLCQSDFSGDWGGRIDYMPRANRQAHRMENFAFAARVMNAVKGR